MCSCHSYPRIQCHVFWSQVEYKIVCFIFVLEQIVITRVGISDQFSYPVQEFMLKMIP